MGEICAAHLTTSRECHTLRLRALGVVGVGDAHCVSGIIWDKHPNTASRWCVARCLRTHCTMPARWADAIDGSLWSRQPQSQVSLGANVGAMHKSLSHPNRVSRKVRMNCGMSLDVDCWE